MTRPGSEAPGSTTLTPTPNAGKLGNLTMHKFCGEQMGRSQMRSAVSTTEISFVHPVLEAALYVEHHYDPGCDLSIQKKPLPPTTRQTCSVAFMSVEDSSPCSPRVNATTRPRKIWTPEEDVTLKTLVARYGDARGPQGHWKDIAAALQDRTAKVKPTPPPRGNMAMRADRPQGLSKAMVSLS